jgi:hypothetical protein
MFIKNFYDIQIKEDEVLGACGFLRMMGNLRKIYGGGS